MQEMMQTSSWSWPTAAPPTVSPMDGSSTIDDDKSASTGPSKQDLTSMRKFHIQADDQGIYYDDEGGFWPVVILRDEMVPDLLRLEHREELLPVLFMRRNDIRYVSRDRIEKLGCAEFHTLLSSDQNKGKEMLLSALAVAYEERGPMDWLAAIRREWGPSTTFWDLETKAQKGRGRTTVAETTVRPKRLLTDHGYFSNLPFSKRQKPNDTPFSGKNGTRIDSDSDIDTDDERVTARRRRGTLWTTEEDAELILVRERILPDAPWADVIIEFNQRFNYPDRSYMAITSRYLNYLQPDASGSGSTDCIMVREDALQLLDAACDRTESQGQITDDEGFSDRQSSELDGSRVDSVREADPDELHWTGPQDAELIRLKEHERISTSRGIAKRFGDKFPYQPRTVKEIRDRYNHYLHPEAFNVYDVAESQEQCDELRCIALSLLDGPTVPSDHDDSPACMPKLPADSGLGSDEDRIEVVQSRYGQRWTAEEDAVLVWLKEVRRESYQRIVQLFGRGFPSAERTPRAAKSRYVDYLKPEAWKSSKAKDRFVCEELRACALSLQEAIDPSIYYDKTADDNSALMLSSSGGKMPWLSHVSHDDDEDENDFPVPSFEDNAARSWTVEEDANLLHLREEYMKDASWSARHSVWTEVIPQCPRSQKSLEARYTRALVAGAGDTSHSWFTSKRCQELQDRALAFLLELGESARFDQLEQSTRAPQIPRSWSVKEDALLLWLREDLVQQPIWNKITRIMHQKMQGCQRSSIAVQHRYMKYLAEDALGSTNGDQDPSEIRRRAQDFIKTLKARNNCGTFDRMNFFGDNELETNTGHLFSIEEDAELIRLKECVEYDSSWSAILESFRQKFPNTGRSQGSLRSRYNAFLQGSKSSSPSEGRAYNATVRQQALRFLSRTAGCDVRRRQQRPKTNIISLLSSDEDDSEQGNCGNDDSAEDTDVDGGDSDAPLASEFLLSAGNEIEGRNDEEGAIDKKSDEEIEGDVLTFLIGEEQQRFRVPITRALGNVYIVDDIIEDDRLGALVTGARWSRLRIEAFRPVYEYLKYGDYRPRIKGQRLVGVGDNIDAHNREIIRCGQVFKLARELQIEELMGLACRKFVLLKKSPLPVLMTARTICKVGCAISENDRLMRRFLVDEVATNFQQYMEEQAKNFFALKVKAPGFWKEVFGKAWAKADVETMDDSNPAPISSEVSETREK